MDFRPRNPIYLQVADYVCEKVLTGAWRDGEKLPAVKDLSVITTVNPNTVIRSLGYLVDHGILTTQRGVGYFLTGTARETRWRSSAVSSRKWNCRGCSPRWSCWA